MSNEYISRLIKLERDKIKSLKKRRSNSSKSYKQTIDKDLKSTKLKIIEYQISILKNKKSELLK